MPERIEDGLLAFVNRASGRVHLAISIEARPWRSRRMGGGEAGLTTYTLCGLVATTTGDGVSSVLEAADPQTILDEPGAVLCRSCRASTDRRLPAHWTAQREAEERLRPLRESGLQEMQYELEAMRKRLSDLKVYHSVLDTSLQATIAVIEREIQLLEDPPAR